MYFATHKTCNLNCSYCYVPEYNKKSLKEDDAFILNALKDFIAKTEREDFRIGSFCLHGSEPSLMEPETMLQVIKSINSHWVKYDIKGYNVAIQTNGLRFTREYLGYLKQNLKSPKMLRIGFSIDPPKQVHDLYRNNSYPKD